MKKILASVLLSLFASAPLLAAELDMNDVSILFPYKEVPNLLEVMPRLSQEFTYPDTQMDRDKQLSQISDRIPPIKDAIEDFALVSLRLDPCSNHLQVQDDKAACTAEIRLVWQKVLNGIFVDSNIHTIHALRKDEFSDILKSLRSLHKAASVDLTGLALAQHPVIAKEGKNSPYLQGVLAFVQRYASARNLKEVANMVANTNSNWTLGHFAIQEGTSHFMTIPALGAGEEIDTINRGFTFTSPLDETFRPHSQGKLGDLQKVGLLKEETLPADLKSELEFFPILRRVVDAFAVENPKLFNPKSINCGTCHVTAKQKQGYEYVKDVAQNKIWRSRFARPNFDYPRDSRGLVDRKEGEGSFLPLEAYGVHAYKNSRWNLDLTSEPANTDGLQIFSFLGMTPSIGARVVNDTAETLDFIETQGQRAEATSS